MLSLSRKIEPATAREISRTMKQLGEKPKLAASIMATHRANIKKILDRQYMATFDLFGTRTLEAAQKALAGTRQVTEAAVEYARKHGAVAVTEITGTTQSQAMKIITDATAAGLTEGLSEIEIARNIQAQIEESSGTLSRLRSRVIARTETHGAMGAANEAAAVATGLPLMKEWVAASGERTRPDHAAASGQKVHLDKPFKVGADSLMYPGDPAGSAKQIVNCRCASVHIVS